MFKFLWMDSYKVIMKTQLDLSEINSLPKNNYKVVSLFSGCGGSSLGYKLNGCNVVLANEFVKEAQEVYSLNHPTTILLKDDIRNISGGDILKLINLQKYELDILDGSPPCAAFSTMGLRDKGWGKEKKYSTNSKKQVVDDLFFEFARILKDLMPKVFIAENVKGLTLGTAKFLLGNNQNTFIKEKSIIHILRDVGYTISFKVLNSMHYEVPQMRERLIIIGVRNDINIKPSFPSKLLTSISTRQAIEDLIDIPTDMKNSPKKTMFIEKYFRPGTSLREAKNIAIKHRLTGVMLYYARRDRWDKPFQTILQSGDRPFHPTVDRSLSIQECKRICTFPDDFILPHSPKLNWERLGRAVPPNLMKHIVKHIISTILSKCKGVTNEKKRTVKRTVIGKTWNRIKGHN